MDNEIYNDVSGSSCIVKMPESWFSSENQEKKQKKIKKYAPIKNQDGSKATFLKAEYTLTCTGCCKEKKTIVVLDKSPSYVWDYCNDIWSPAIPNGWMQCVEGEGRNMQHLFFHSDKCYKKWLKSQGKFEELEDFENGIWIA